MITVLPVFREEGWHSMDLCSDMLVKHSPTRSELRLSVPHYRKIFGFLPWKKVQNFNRWYNRWKIYPKHVEKLGSQNGFFHIVDHSYAHLANYLPDGKVGIYCHDLDAFRCILFPDQEIRPLWFRRMMSQVFEGFKKARIVFCSTHITRDHLLKLGIWKAEAILVVPYGVATEFTPEGDKERGEYILNVGSCITRKRVDVLFDAFAKVSKQFANLKLIQAGGSFSTDQINQLCRLNLKNKVEQRRNLTREGLARLYRGAKCLVITSEAEGFGLPIIEGLACGAKIIASDIPILREVGGPNICYFPAKNPDACAEVILKFLKTYNSFLEITASRWSWASHASDICRAYESL